MENLKSKLAGIDWQLVTEKMNEKGYAVIPGLVPGADCDELIQLYGKEDLYRKTVIMEHYRFGLGEYKYFNYPLPVLVQSIRETVYPYLAPVANGWMEALKSGPKFPPHFESFLKLCHSQQQMKPTALILKYGKGGFNTLHQDLYGAIFFPIQMVVFLNKPGEDYKGGEFVLIQQKPRAQSKAIVLQPAKGDMLVFTTNFRPVKGSNGYYKVNMKHGVSEVLDGTRHTLGIIFHDAIN